MEQQASLFHIRPSLSSVLKKDRSLPLVNGAALSFPIGYLGIVTALAET